MSQSILLGRIETLSKDQELRLKQVWAHLFQFWGIVVDDFHVLSKEKDQKTLKVNETEISNDLLSNSNKKSTTKKKFFGRFRKNKEEEVNPVSTYNKHRRASSVTSTRSKESIEAVYTHNLIHESLKDLKAEEIRENFWNMLRTDYPDNLLLRFLRARKWDTDKALGMIAHTLHWRLKEAKPDDIILGGELAFFNANETGTIKNIELSKATIRGYDKSGHPIVYVRPRLHHASDQSEAEMRSYALLIIEQTRLFLKEPVDAATILFDLSGFSMSNMDYAPVKYLISCFEAHYPECLGKLFIHKAPWIFPPIWNVIKNWLDPVVASKITFTKTIDDLAEYIPMKYIPKDLGGDDDFDFDTFSKPDGSFDEKLKDTKMAKEIMTTRQELINKFIQATVSWIESINDEESSKYLNLKIELSKELSANYSQLDPYIRSRSVYDIRGTLKV